MKAYNFDGSLNKLAIVPHNIVFSWTSEIYYEMQRCILLEDAPNLEYDEYLVLEGEHCSCYDFDETIWDATVYTKKELKTLANLRSDESEFWSMIKNHF